MEEVNVRIKKIKIQNLKNVKSGEISLENDRRPFKASILGLYGQNGSGKTTLINAIELLKYALCGKKIPAYFADYVNIGMDHAKLSFDFIINANDGIYEVFYDFCIKKESDISEQNSDSAEDVNKSKAVIYDEVLQYSFKSVNNSSKIRKSPLVNTITDKVFVPLSKYKDLVGKDKNTEMDLLVEKKCAYNESRSFIFSRKLLNVMRKKAEATSEKADSYLQIIEYLVIYGNYELFIIQTQNTGVISLNALPLSFKHIEKGHMSVGQIMVPLESTVTMPSKMANTVDRVLNSMNIVLNQLVPGLTISAKKLGPTVLKDGSEGVCIQLVTERHGETIPLKYESEGIKKIISILDLLIAVYNQPSVTVAIDELDSGIFEYLLGELLRILSENGKGQLIFTSHNLRPLETLDIGFVAFTTTNPLNRFVRIPNVKKSNNVRSYYYRDMTLGISKEPLYDVTNNAEIDMAFREAGEINAT